MLDQTFSAKNFLSVYEQQNRMGRVPKETMGMDFQSVVAQIVETNKELQDLRNKKKAEKTEEDENKITELKENQKELRKQKQKVLLAEMKSLAAEVNKADFRFKFQEDWIYGKKVFKIDSTDHAQLFAMKQLQQNLQRTFKVKQANRHLIMTNLKLLLKTRRPFYIIRTDVSSFFESIPQDQLRSIIFDNTLLSHKSKKFVEAIIREYEAEKAKMPDEEKGGMPTGCGVPRGIGISSFLSEIYMRDLDNNIRKRPEVIFYARYVDDIFMLLAELPLGTELEDYYHQLEDDFKEKGLRLKPIGADKCSAIDCTRQEEDSHDVTYLGYKLCIFSNMSKPKKEGDKTKWKNTDVTFSMSDAKCVRIKHRIDNAFKRFDAVNRRDIHQARKDLVDSLKLITGNVRLHKSKSGIKTGLYYNSDLLDGETDLKELNTYLYNKEVTLHPKLFRTEKEKEKYLTALNTRIHKFDFVSSWKSRKIYELSSHRLHDIMRWLNEDDKEEETHETEED